MADRVDNLQEAFSRVRLSLDELVGAFDRATTGISDDTELTPIEAALFTRDLAFLEFAHQTSRALIALNIAVQQLARHSGMDALCDAPGIAIPD